MKPIIAISANREFVAFPGAIGLDRTYINTAYNEAIYNAGGIPMIIPFIHDRTTLIPLFDHVDAVLLSGGSDVSPLLYGQQPKPSCGSIDPLIDQFNMALIETTLAMNKPLFGICRGMQMINVYCGGTLIQDIPSMVNDPIKHDQHCQMDRPTHTVSLKQDDFLYDLYGPTTCVNSFHHQSVDRLGQGLRCIAYASDGVKEAMVDPSRHIYAVQWHPEWMAQANNVDGCKFFEWMVKTIIDDKAQ